MKLLVIPMTLFVAILHLATFSSGQGSLGFVSLGSTPGVDPVQLGGGQDYSTTGQYSLTSNQIPIPDRFRFGDDVHTGVYVNSQGYLSFQDRTVQFSYSIPNHTVAPFRNNETSYGGGTTYEVHDATMSKSPFLDRVSTFISEELCLGTVFAGKWMLVVEWNLDYSTANSQVNNFQGVLITDGDQSYTVFTYHCQRMNRTNMYSIGFTADSNFQYNQPVVSSATTAPYRDGCEPVNQFSSSIIYKLDSGHVCTTNDTRLNQCGSNKGKVQACTGSRTPRYWVNVCDTNWTVTDAAVVCRQLGFPFEGAVSTMYDNVVYSSERPECQGDEEFLSECMVHVNGSACSHVAVECQMNETQGSSESGSSSVGVIVGAAVGTIVVLLILGLTLVILAVLWVKSKKAHTRDVEDATRNNKTLGKEVGQSNRYSGEGNNNLTYSAKETPGFSAPEYATLDVGGQRMETRFISEASNPNYTSTAGQETPVIHNYDLPKGDEAGEPEMNLVNPLYYPSIPVSPTVSPSPAVKHPPEQHNFIPRDYEVALNSPAEIKGHPYEEVPPAMVTTGNTGEYSKLELGETRHQYATLETYTGDVLEHEVGPVEKDEEGYSHLKRT